MSEYVEIEAEVDDEEPQNIYFYTNVPLTRPGSPAELYRSPAEMAEGTPLAQALAVIEGVTSLIILGEEMTIVREIGISDHAIIADVSAVIRDFFL